MKLTPREVAILEVLAIYSDETKRGMYAGRVGALAGFEDAGRRDAGATRTLDSLWQKNKRNYVTFEYDRTHARRWYITEAGRNALAEFAFGE